jgi:hypothetical protein
MQQLVDIDRSTVAISEGDGAMRPLLQQNLIQGLCRRCARKPIGTIAPAVYAELSEISQKTRKSC